MFDPEFWLSVAEEAATVTDPEVGEAWFRTAVNRSYYAALMTVAARVLEEQGAEALPADSADTHRRVKQGLRRAGKNGAPILYSLYDELRGLEDLRDSADYRLLTACQKDLAVEATRRGRSLVDRINALAARYFENLPVHR